MVQPLTLPFSETDLRIDPIERSETIPSRWYTDPVFQEIDRQLIFSTSWQCIGHSLRLQHPGTYLSGTVASDPVIIVRGKDDVVRAFYNVCRHRGGPIVTQESGSCNILQCQYHGWTYLLDGSLRGVPKFDRAELFDRKDYGLHSLHLHEWEGLIFLHAKHEHRQPLDFQRVVDGISARIKPISPATKKFYKRIVYNVECNWKVYVDNYLEGYHLPFVHPELCNLLDYANYKTEASEFYSLQYSPFTGTENLYGKSDGEAFYYFIFPNIMLNILPGRLQTNVVLPVAHNKCSVIFDYYYDDVTSPAAKKLIEDDIGYSDRVQQEDMEICRLVQRGLESVAYDKGRFSVEMEQAVYHFQSLLKQSYRRGLSQSKHEH